MRPPEFTGGNHSERRLGVRRKPRFNEAAGIHRRKPRQIVELHVGIVASMRPPEFTGGNDVLSGVSTS